MADGAARLTVTVRAAAPADFEAALQLGKMMHAESDYRDEPFDEELVRLQLPELAAKSSVFFAVAELPDGTLAGFMVATAARRFFNRLAYSDEFLTFVRPEWRGRGIFEALLAAWETWAKAAGMTHTLFGRTTDWSAPEALTPLMAQRGYARIGATYRKAIR